MRLRINLDGNDTVIEARKVFYDRGILVIVPTVLDDKIGIEMTEKQADTALDLLYQDGKIDCRKFKASVSKLKFKF